MKIRRSLVSGIRKALRAWKGVLIVWLFSFVPAFLYVVPLRSALRSGFGKSMMTEKFAVGFDLEAFLDLGSSLPSVISSMTSGFILLLIVSIILNAFLTGGVFDALSGEKPRFSTSEFFRAGSVNFWSFLMITLAMSFILIFFSGALLLVTMGIVAGFETIPEKKTYIIQMISLLFVVLLSPVFILAADFARAGKASGSSMSGISAIGFGFSRTFSEFWSAYPMMLLLIACQLLPAVFAYYLIPVWRPVTGKGVFLLFITTQMILFLRFFLKAWRYGSVTALMETSLKKRQTSS
jgi:hypothetical protein